MSNHRSRAVITGLAVCCVMAFAGEARTASHSKDGAAKAPAAKSAAAAVEKATPKTDPAHDAMMAEMMKYASPTAAHQWLKNAEGKWNATVKMWQGPGEPVVSKGVSDNRMILGGRYLEQRFTGTFMEQPFEGVGLLGYDNKKKEYTSFWVDNSSTNMMTSTGTVDQAGKQVTMKSLSDGPDGKPMEMKTVTKIVDADTHVFSMYGPLNGQEMLMMEITYARAK